MPRLATNIHDAWNLVTFERIPLHPYLRTCIYHLLAVGMRSKQSQHLLPCCQRSGKTINLPDTKDDRDLCLCTFNTCHRLIKRVRDPTSALSLFLAESRGHATDFQTDFLGSWPFESSTMITVNEAANKRETRSPHTPQCLFLERDKSLSWQIDVELYLMRNCVSPSLI